MDVTTRLVGLAMLIAGLLVFVSLLPRRGRVSPILRTDLTEQVLMMTLITLIFAGAIMGLAGAPTGMPATH
jgi:hypothetical protein